MGRYPPVLLEAVALLRQDRVPGLGAVLAPFATLEHEERGLLEVDLDLDQRPALELEEPQLLSAALNHLLMSFSLNNIKTLTEYNYKRREPVARSFVPICR